MKKTLLTLAAVLCCAAVFTSCNDDISWSVQHLDRYSLSVCLYKQTVYNFDFIGAGADIKSNIGTSYEQCTFHKLTGWGDFLRINNGLPWGNPTSGGGGPIE